MEGDLMSGWNDAELSETAARPIPDTPAQAHDAARHTGRQFDERAGSAARTLLKAGAQEQGEVAQYLHDCPAYGESGCVAWRAGLVRRT
jgi:hypothetical protein